MNYSKFQERSPCDRRSKCMNSFKWKKNIIKTIIGMKFNTTFSNFFLSSNNNNYESTDSVIDEDPDEETKYLKAKTLQKIQKESNFISLPLTYLNSEEYEGNTFAITKNKSHSHLEIKTGSSRKKKKNFFFPQEQMRSFFNGDDLLDCLDEHHYSSSSTSEKKNENTNSGFIIEGNKRSITPTRNSVKNNERNCPEKNLSLVEQEKEENEIFKRYYYSKQGFSSGKDSPKTQKSFFTMKTSQYYGKSLTNFSKWNNKLGSSVRFHSNEEKMENESTKFHYNINQLFWYDFERMKEYKYYLIHNNSSEILKKLKRKKKLKAKSIKTHKSYINYI